MARLVKIEPLGVEDVYDLTVDEHHNYIANGIVVHNCMQVAQKLSGFNPIEANKLRKVLIKEKNPEVLDKMRKKFIEGAKPRVAAGEVTEKEVEDMFSLLHSFSKYGFNRAHAMTYSAVTAAEMWLKFKFTTEYMTALLKNTGNNEKTNWAENVLVFYIKYCRRKLMTVLNPNINANTPEFDIVADKTIRYGLDHIKMVATNASKIVALAPFTNFEDFYNRVNRTKVNKRVVANLIAAGAFDELGHQMVIDHEVAKLKKHDPTLDDAAARLQVIANEVKVETDKYRNAIAIEYHRLRKDKKAAVPEQKTIEQWWEDEKSVIGICLSRPPILYKYKDIIDNNKYTRISEAPYKGEAFIFGRVESCISKKSKAGNSMFVVELTDDVDSMSFFVFETARNQYQKELKIGSVAAIPMKRFEDSPTRFYDIRKESIIIKRDNS